MIHYNPKDIIGTTIGYFKILSNIKPKNKHNKKSKCYVCRCFCGKELVLTDYQLYTKSPKSCGCWRGLPPGRTVKNKHYGKYLNTAKRKKLVFSLTQDEFDKLVTAPCFYCGREPYRIIRSEDNKFPLALNGLDRMNNTKGYIKGNVVSCCPQCNTMKMDYPVLDFYKSILNISLNTLKKFPKSNFAKLLREKITQSVEIASSVDIIDPPKPYN